MKRTVPIDNVIALVCDMLGDDNQRNYTKLLRFAQLIAVEMGVRLAPTVKYCEKEVEDNLTVTYPKDCFSVISVGQLVGGIFYPFQKEYDGVQGAIEGSEDYNDLFAFFGGDWGGKVERSPVSYTDNKSENRIVLSSLITSPATVWLKYKVLNNEFTLEVPVEYQLFYAYRILQLFTSTTPTISMRHKRAALVELTNIQRSADSIMPEDFSAALRKYNDSTVK